MTWKTKNLLRFSLALLMVLTLCHFNGTTQAQSETRPPTESDGKLLWKFAEGDMIKTNMQQEINVDMVVGGQEMRQSTESINEMTISIDSVDSDGVATASNTIDRMMNKTSAGSMTMEYDSNSTDELEGPSKMIGDMLKPMIGVAMTQKMSPSGKIYDVEVPEEMMEGTKKNPQMGAMFNKKSLEDMANKAALEFPETNPDVGFTWDVNSEIAMGPMTVATDTTYTYLGVAEIEGKPLHKIKADIKMSFPDGFAGGEVEVAEENSVAHFYFDGNAGRLARSEMNQDVVMNIVANGQEIEQHLVQTMVMEMTSVEK